MSAAEQEDDTAAAALHRLAVGVGLGDDLGLGGGDGGCRLLHRLEFAVADADQLDLPEHHAAQAPTPPVSTGSRSDGAGRAGRGALGRGAGLEAAARRDDLGGAARRRNHRRLLDRHRDRLRARQDAVRGENGEEPEGEVRRASSGSPLMMKFRPSPIGSESVPTTFSTIESAASTVSPPLSSTAGSTSGQSASTCCCRTTRRVFALCSHRQPLQSQ